MLPATGLAPSTRALRRADRPKPGRPVTITGAAGTLRWGYQTAATIREWTVTRQRRSSTLRGTLDGYNSAYVYQRGVHFNTLTQAGAWEWPVRRIEIVGSRVTAELGPQQREHP
jgi:hypothetical protein